MIHVNFKLLRAVGELASTSIRTVASLHEVFAE